jgi:hypothetical protein
VLRACKRVLRPGGRFALTVIERAPGLSRATLARIAEAAPRAVAARKPYPELLAGAGFTKVGFRDATAEYLQTSRDWLAATEPLREQVAAIDGEEAVAQKLLDWRRSIEAIEAGWLFRRLYWARA